MSQGHAKRTIQFCDSSRLSDFAADPKAVECGSDRRPGVDFLQAEPGHLCISNAHLIATIQDAAIALSGERTEGSQLYLDFRQRAGHNRVHGSSNRTFFSDSSCTGLSGLMRHWWRHMLRLRCG